MSDRITGKTLREYFPLWCKCVGLRVAKDHTDVGGVLLRGGYGGYEVQQILNKGGGAQEVVLHYHAPARVLYEAMQQWVRCIAFNRNHGKA